MKPMSTGLVGAALLALTTVAAQADCAAELARLTGGGTAAEGISKDGSLAPLETAADAAAAGADAAASQAADTAEAAGMTSAAPTDSAASGGAATDTAAEGNGGIAKDGSHTPLEGAGGQQPGVAMSGADAAAQQKGQPTAAEQATGAAGDQSTRDAHIQAARDALAAGDEDACMKAIEAAQSS
ncbi:hypothetical protein [Paracoccus shandongensis]|uniref:hypothetical protein n=1 Tax=Paracoccus shandongensis TaxID=2816048 RepID=UPI001F39FC67|nr:hypothetical protein [Paracoccus shandongensis]